MRHFARLEHPVLRVDRGALAPDLLDGDATPPGLSLRGTLRHCGSHPSGQHRVGGHAERPRILGNRAGESNQSVLGSGIGTAATLACLTGCRAGEYQPSEAALTHAPDGETRELERTVEIDAHRFAPHLRILLPHEPLVSRTDAMIHHQ